MQQVKVGIIGLGAIAEKTHIPILSKLSSVRLDSAVDIDEKRTNKISKKWNISNIFNNYEDMIKESNIDAVYICLPNFLHYKVAKFALEHNKNVFCEKPMGLNSNEALELVNIAKDKKLVLAVGYNKRLEDQYIKTAQYVQSLKLGKILQVNGVVIGGGPYVSWIPASDWFFKDIYGVLFDQGSHIIDLLQFILNDKISHVSAISVSTMYDIKTIDNLVVLFKTLNGTIGTLNIGWRHAIYHDSFQIFGTGGSISSNPSELEIRHGDDGPYEKLTYHLNMAKQIFSNYFRQVSNSYIREDIEFIDAIRFNKNPAATGNDALRTLEVLEAIRESIAYEKTVKVNYKQ